MNLKERLEGQLGMKDLQEITQIASGNNAYINELLNIACDNCTDLPSIKRSTNAAWALQHLLSSDLTYYIYPQKDTLINVILNSSSQSKQRILLSILRETAFNAEEIRTDFLDFCMDGMLKCNFPYGVRALCIHLAYKQCRHYPELTDELKQQLELMDDEILPAGIKSAKANTLKAIKLLKREKGSHTNN